MVSRIRNADLEGGLSRVIRSAPNSNIVINVTVQSRNDRVMMLRRPVGARVWSAFYQAGAHETMNWSEPGRPIENCYELATRALREEINLPRSEGLLHNIVFSWFGFYAAEVSAYFFAHVKTRLEEDELVERVAEAEGAFEVEDIDWYSLDHPTISNVLATWIDGPWRPQHDELGREYLPHTTISLTQLWRVTRQHMLERPAHEEGSDVDAVVPFGFDPTSVGFFRIIDWNANRRLDRVHNIGEVRRVDSVKNSDCISRRRIGWTWPASVLTSTRRWSRREARAQRWLVTTRTRERRATTRCGYGSHKAGTSSTWLLAAI